MIDPTGHGMIAFTQVNLVSLNASLCNLNAPFRKGLHKPRTHTQARSSITLRTLFSLHTLPGWFTIHHALTYTVRDLERRNNTKSREQSYNKRKTRTPPTRKQHSIFRTRRSVCSRTQCGQAPHTHTQSHAHTEDNTAQYFLAAQGSSY